MYWFILTFISGFAFCLFLLCIWIHHECKHPKNESNPDHLPSEYGGLQSNAAGEEKL